VSAGQSLKAGILSDPKRKRERNVEKSMTPEHNWRKVLQGNTISGTKLLQLSHNTIRDIRSTCRGAKDSDKKVRGGE